jgi:mannose-1-phosphate guanylyltransferase/mannose-1-phosphate guanylyltransferase/mannose-6-phosphate isomerase
MPKRMKKRLFGILSGGSGTRLWPLSRTAFPKQFQDLAGIGAPLIITTVERFKALGMPVIITSQKLVSTTHTSLHRHAHTDVALLVEPEGKNTSAAIALMTSVAFKENPDATIGIFPADHHIQKPESFTAIVEKAYELAEQHQCIITIGITPTYAATEYGYILLDAPAADGSHAVTRFIEKPDATKAAELIATGNVVWNAGMFIFPARIMAQLLEIHLPEIWNPIHNAANTDELAQAYTQVPSVSIDYGLMEKISSIRCLPADIGWSDLGSWEAVMDARTDVHEVNQISGSGNAYLHMHPAQKSAHFIGVDDTYVIDTPDTLLVIKRGHGQSVRDIVKKLESEQSPLLHEHTFEDRPWGRFEILLDTPHYKSKRLILLPGKKISYQRHKYRTENWTVLKGEASILLDGVETIAQPGDHITITPGTMHRLANAGTHPLEILEAQTGSYFGEDDIERFDDDFGRS